MQTDLLQTFVVPTGNATRIRWGGACGTWRSARGEGGRVGRVCARHVSWVQKVSIYVQHAAGDSGERARLLRTASVNPHATMQSRGYFFYTFVHLYTLCGLYICELHAGDPFQKLAVQIEWSL